MQGALRKWKEADGDPWKATDGCPRKCSKPFKNFGGTNVSGGGLAKEIARVAKEIARRAKGMARGAKEMERNGWGSKEMRKNP